jgi:hypothetical protein
MNITRRLVLTVAMAAAVPVFAESEPDSINKDESGVAINDTILSRTLRKAMEAGADARQTRPESSGVLVAIRQAGR